jgi:hypothetical protein
VRTVALIAVLGAKGAPGATTAALALALVWPRPVVVLDTDPAGGDIAVGWLGGRIDFERGLLSFVAANRHTNRLTPADLAPHLVAVPEHRGISVLPGLSDGRQAAGIDSRLWTVLALAATAMDPDADVLADCGRASEAAPWPLLEAASTVLLAARPTLRGAHHARQAAWLARTKLGQPPTVGMLLCGSGPYGRQELTRATGLATVAELAADERAASVLSDGALGRRVSPRTALLRSARSALGTILPASSNVYRIPSAAQEDRR